MKIKEYLFKYRIKNKTPYYTIRIHNVCIASRSDYDEIMKIYRKCEKCGWDSEQLKIIKKKHKIGNNVTIMKYIYKNKNGSYFIHRHNKYYCSSKNLDEIIKYRNELEEIGWDTEKFESSYRKRKKWNLPKYISRTGDKYIICYQHETYGTYKTLEEAVAERDLLMKYDWDYNFVDLY